MKNVLVTGGAGYVGSHTCKALAKAGYQPIVYDNLTHGHTWAVQWGPLEQGDLLDLNRLTRVLREHRIQSVLHFAGLAHVGESVAKPEIYYQNNVVGSMNLLLAMHEVGVNRIVFSSSCATYGVPQQIPITEEHLQAPINPYGQTKLIIEQMLRDFRVAHQLHSISLRYFNAAGADPESQLGEAHSPETHLIPIALEAALRIRKSLSIFGNDYLTFDGTCIRDYVHVTDLAEAHVLALKALESEKFSSHYNLGLGRGFSVKEIIQSCERVTGKKIPILLGSRRPGDPAVLIADNRKAKSELGWHPSFTEIDTIIETALKFLESSKNK